MTEDEQPENGSERPVDSIENDGRPTTEDTMTDTVDETDHGTEREEADEPDEGSDLWRTLNYVLLAGLSLLALIATLQLYLNVSSAINQWISHEYRPVFQALFQVVVLLLVGSAMVWQVRRLRE